MRVRATNTVVQKTFHDKQNSFTTITRRGGAPGGETAYVAAMVVPGANKGVTRPRVVCSTSRGVRWKVLGESRALRVCLTGVFQTMVLLWPVAQEDLGCSFSQIFARFVFEPYSNPCIQKPTFDTGNRDGFE